MDLADYATLISDALRRNEVCIFAARCSIRYSGRAESDLPEGERIFIIKSDKALLVHQPHGNTPINYMKPGCAISLRLDDMMHLHAALDKERLDVQISRVHFFNSALLKDGQVLRVAGTEADMSDML